MVFDLDLGAIRSIAQKHVATPGYVATAATLATTATKSAQSVAVVATVATVASSHGLEITPKTPESVATVATVATVASSHGLATHPQAPAPDPGHDALLTLAMTYCDRTGASDKARAQWQQDIADTTPKLRGDLYAHLRAQLPPAPPRPAPAPAPTPPAPRCWLHLDSSWRELDRQYICHHWQCPSCRTA